MERTQFTVTIVNCIGNVIPRKIVAICFVVDDQPIGNSCIPNIGLLALMCCPLKRILWLTLKLVSDCKIAKKQPDSYDVAVM